MYYGLEMEFVGYGVVAIASPGMAAQDATHGKVEALECSMFLKGFNGVLRAGGREAARGRCQRADDTLIETDGEYEEVTEQGMMVEG